MNWLSSQKSPVRVAIITGLILLIPLVLTLLNSNASLYGGAGGGWDWAPMDFLAMGFLLFIAGMAIDFVARRFHPLFRYVTIAVIVLAFLALWVELAVDGVSQFLEFIF